MTDRVETYTGEILRFETKAEFDAFCAGFALGDEYGTYKDWSDGYREDDLVGVEFDAERMEARSKRARYSTGEAE